nr:uncharacterized protein LOC115266563 [Aedes albopictus]
MGRFRSLFADAKMCTQRCSRTVHMIAASMESSSFELVADRRWWYLPETKMLLPSLDADRTKSFQMHFINDRSWTRFVVIDNSSGRQPIGKTDHQPIRKKFPEKEISREDDNHLRRKSTIQLCDDRKESSDPSEMTILRIDLCMQKAMEIIHEGQ